MNKPNTTEVTPQSPSVEEKKKYPYEVVYAPWNVWVWTAKDEGHWKINQEKCEEEECEREKGHTGFHFTPSLHIEDSREGNGEENNINLSDSETEL